LAAPQRGSSLAVDITNVVYGPSTIAYGLAAFDFKWLALALYLLFMTAAFGLRLFRKLGDWPTISRIALFLSPLYVASGFFIPAYVVRWWVMLPVALYIGVAIVAGLALHKARANLER
jgi:hypothetical protein